MKNKKKTLFAVLAMVSVMSVSGIAGACQNQKYVKLVFETNGAQSIQDAKLEENSSYTLPIPAREGYEFQGWYLNADFSGSPVTSVVAKADATYYAKWEKLYEVKIDLNGGFASWYSASKIYLKAGENVYDAMKDYVPEKSGFSFGAWYIGNAELSKNERMPKEDITLIAMYKVQYTVELWEEKLDGEGYEKNEEQIVEYGFIGDTVTYEHDNPGFVLVETEDTVDELVLSENVSDNVLKYYFDRQTYKVSFKSNYPNGEKEDRYDEEIKFGKEKEIPAVDFKAEGYMLSGWAYSVDGEIAFTANNSKLEIYNGEIQSEVPTYTAERNVSLYAVWSKGYTDMFGGNDYLFIPSEDGEDIFLVRENVLFKGIYNAEAKTFRFLKADGDILIQGGIFDNNTFAYSSAERDGNSSTLYKVGVGLVDNENIIFDSYNGITYMQTDENGVLTSSKGTYVIDENGYYVATFTDGPLAEKTLVMMVGTVSMKDGTTKQAFQLRNDDEYNLGVMYCGVVYQGQLIYYTSVYQLMLSGFGTAYYNNNGTAVAYYYVTDANGTITLVDSSTSKTVMTIRTTVINGQNCYLQYNSSFDVEFASEDGATLTLDGMGSAVYKKGTKSTEGYYTVASSVFGGYIVSMTSDGKTCKYLVNAVTSEVSKDITDADGNVTTETETVVSYVFEEKNAEYAEYYFKAASNVLYSPLFVITGEGKGSVYYRENGVYVIVSDGTYSYNQQTGRYVYVTEKFYKEEAVTVVGEKTTDEGKESISLDLAKIKTFDFSLSVVSNYNVNYWFAFEDVEDQSTDYVVTYSGKDNSTLSLVTLSSIATYSGNGKVLTGTYSTKNGYFILTVSGSNMYFILDEEAKTFTLLSSAPYTSYGIGTDGSLLKTETLYFDGLGNATYSVQTTDSEGNTETLTYEGKVVSLDKKTAFDTPVYKFESDEYSFEYLALQTSSYYCFGKYNEKYNGAYNSDAEGMLLIDGYGYTAKYTDAEGNVYSGVYWIPTDGTILLSTTERYYYFDVTGTTFTVRGEEYGSYYVLDNQALRAVILEMDGYGKLTVSNGKEQIGTGTYEKGDVYKVTYTVNDEQITLYGCLDTLVYSGTTIPVFAVTHEEVVNVYVNAKDWSVLILDKIGNATKYDVNGLKETGTYMIIAEGLLYYVNDAGTDATIYEYNAKTGSATQKVFNSRGYNYFTDKLESLRFTRYGFAIFNNETRYFYNIVDDEVIIYHKDGTAENANEYGFVEEKFGKFDAVKEYGGKTYYFSSNSAVELKRETETKDKYPLQFNDGNYYPIELLLFTPSGGATFNVSGSVRINGKDYSCVVTRKYNEESESYENYVTVGSYFRFYIDYEYKGEDEQGASTGVYEVVGMKYVVSCPSYSYMYMYLIYQMFYGSDVANSISNTVGSIELVTEFNENGEQTISYVNGVFGKASGMTDTEGNIVTLEKVAYTYSKESGMYSAEVTATDGYKYRMYFTLKSLSSVGYCYQLYAFTRIETLVDGIYTVETERIIATESNYAAGTFYNAKLYKNDEIVECDKILIVKGNLCFIARTYDDQGKIASSTYYNVVLTEKESDAIEGEETGVAVYESVSVTEESVTTVYSSDGKSYVDFDGNEIKLIVIDGNAYLPSETSYDEASKTYTVKLSNNKVYTIRIGEDSIVSINEVTEQAE